jgi:hypothetical protein
MIIGLIFTDSLKEFQEYQEIIFSSSIIDDKKKLYLKKMLAIKEKWSTAYQPLVFNGGIHTISRAESVNS